MRVNLNQGDPQWHEWRRNKITASWVAAIMGEDPYRSRKKAWGQFVGLIPQDPDNYFMQHGRTMEPVARHAVENEMGTFYFPCCYQSDIYEWAAASLDGISSDGTTVLEIKCPQRMPEEIKRAHWIQVQWQLMCVPEAKRAIICYYVDNHIKLFYVDKDPEYIEKMIEEAKKFLQETHDLEELECDERECVHLNSEQALIYAALIQDADDNAKKWSKIRDDAKENLIALGEGKNLVVGNLKLSKCRRPGAIDYDKIPELVGVDKEKYRKLSTESWRLIIKS